MIGVRPPSEEPVPISLVAHQVFCPRRVWLEAAGEATDTWQMAVGATSHAVTDDPAIMRPASLRAIDVSDEAIGITGRCDTVEVTPNGRLTVVEYKSTSRPDRVSPPGLRVPNDLASRHGDPGADGPGSHRRDAGALFRDSDPVSRDAARRYLVAYDVADDRRRLRVATKLSSYGDRVQFSVFVVDARPANLVRLRAALSRLIDFEIDSVLICDLGPVSGDTDCRFDMIGRSRPVSNQRVLVL